MNSIVQKALKILGILILVLIIYLGYRVHASGRRLIPISVLAVIAGVLFEGKRLSGKWTPFLWIAMGSFFLACWLFCRQRAKPLTILRTTFKCSRTGSLLFLPGKKTFFNEQYFRDIKDLKSKHVRRYSEEQVSRLYALYCVLFAGTVFVLNYRFQVFPRHLAIWMVFGVFPLLLTIYEARKGGRILHRE